MSSLVALHHKLDLHTLCTCAGSPIARRPTLRNLPSRARFASRRGIAEGAAHSASRWDRGLAPLQLAGCLHPLHLLEGGAILLGEASERVGLEALLQLGTRLRIDGIPEGGAPCR